MVVETVLLVVVLVLVVLVVFPRHFNKPKGFPPGVWGLPLVGALPPNGATLQTYFYSLKSKFGDIFTVRLGSRVAVVLADYHLIKSSLAILSLNGRPDFYTFHQYTYYDNLGISFSSGQVWSENRRFTLRHLRDFGMGKSKMEGTIQTEVAGLIDHLCHNTDKPTKFGRQLNLAILNVIWSLTAGRRFDIGDKYMQRFSHIADRNLALMQGPMALLDLMPWLIPVLPNFLKAKWMNTNEYKENISMLYEFFEKELEEHRITLDPDNPRDYIDAYLLEVEAQKDNPDSVFSTDPHRNLMANLADLFVAGSETTASTLNWVVLYMVLNPKVQRRVQEELDDVVPRDTLPDLSHKDRLPYLEAMLLEAQRRASLVPVALCHYCTEDTQLDGYTIPKGTMVMPFQEGCHYDKRYFEKPHEFYPEHFLDEQGKVITKKEGFLPFGIGRRMCPGESLARMELYLFTAAILQKFTITSPPGVTLTTDIETDKMSPILNIPKPFSVIFTKRETI